jgi:hypothetical protein
MPLVCEISRQAYCRPNDVIRSLILHAPTRMSANLTIFAQVRAIHIAFSAR